MIPVTFKQNIEKELEVFWAFINNEQNLRYRNSIFRSFPDLQERLSSIEGSEAKKEFLGKYILEFRNTKKEQFEKFEKIQREKLKQQSGLVLEKLEEVMEYKEENSKGYDIIPVIIPFSPFKGNTFFYSVLGSLRAKMSPFGEVVFVLAHEVSHLLLFKILKNSFFEDKYKLKPNELYFLKEILVVPILKDTLLINILNSKEYRGNPIISYLNVNSNGLNQSITQYFEDLYNNCKKNGKTFNYFVEVAIKTIKSISEELDVKNEMWNKYGADRKKYSKEIQEYSQPIAIK